MESICVDDPQPTKGNTRLTRSNALKHKRPCIELSSRYPRTDNRISAAACLSLGIASSLPCLRRRFWLENLRFTHVTERRSVTSRIPGRLGRYFRLQAKKASPKIESDRKLPANDPPDGSFRNQKTVSKNPPGSISLIQESFRLQLSDRN